MPRHPINHTLRAQNPQHRTTPTRNLSPSSILDNTRAKTQTDRLRLEKLQVLFGFGLQGDFGLSFAFPAAQDRGVGGVCEEVFVAGEGCVGGLGGDFACSMAQIISYERFFPKVSGR